MYLRVTKKKKKIYNRKAAFSYENRQPKGNKEKGGGAVSIYIQFLDLGDFFFHRDYVCVLFFIYSTRAFLFAFNGFNFREILITETSRLIAPTVSISFALAFGC